MIPAWWDASFDLVDEVWVYSSYVAENLARATDVDVPVVVVPLPVTTPDAHGATVPFELPDGFVFLFAFDFFSTLERKNPLGLIEAFKRAFEPGEGPTLLLKTINARFRPEARERLRHAIGDRDDIRLVDAMLEPAEMAALFQRADSYVSLHRAEGYGLTLAESMALGKPVIATGFSGNTDFMTPANSYLVDWTLTEVGPEAEHYPEDGIVGRALARARRRDAARGLRRPRGRRGARRPRRRRHRRLADAPRRSGRSRASGSSGSAAAARGAPRRRRRGAAPGRRLRAPARVRPRRRRPRRAEGRRAPRAVPRAAPVHGVRARARPRARRRRSGGSRSSCTATAPPASREQARVQHRLDELGRALAALTAPPGGAARARRPPGGDGGARSSRASTTAQRQLDELMARRARRAVHGRRGPQRLRGRARRPRARLPPRGRGRGGRRRVPPLRGRLPRPARARGRAGRALRRAARGPRPRARRRLRPRRAARAPQGAPGSRRAASTPTRAWRRAPARPGSTSRSATRSRTSSRSRPAASARSPRST